MFGQPFGSGHAVPNPYYRVAEWLAGAAWRLFGLNLDHLFDDIFLVEPEWSIHLSGFCFRELCKL
jgi:hypothetical protein